MIKIAINGFGRIGMAFLRLVSKYDDMQITHINDIQSFDKLAYLLKKDSVFGDFRINGKCAKITIDSTNKTLNINNQTIIISNVKNPADSTFGPLDLVLESSGAFLDCASLQPYIKNGAKKVLLSAPPIDDMPIFIIGVNHQLYNGESIISNASCTSNAIAPIIYAINNKRDIFGEICNGNITTIHPCNSDQSILDSPHSANFRLNRNATLNIIPISSSIGRVLGRLFKNLGDRFYGNSVRIPTSIVSFSNVDLLFHKKITKEDILALNINPNIIGFDDELCVSSDFIGDNRSAIIATDLVHTNNNLIRIPLWFDNESGYANRLVDMARLMCNLHTISDVNTKNQ